jgi:hypothetical protein
MAVVEYSTRTPYTEPPLTPEEHAEKFPKAKEVTGNNVLKVEERVLDRDDVLPDTVKVTALKTRKHPWSRTKGVKLLKPTDRDHFRVSDAVRQLTQSERGFRVTGRDDTGEQIKPITVFVDRMGGSSDQDKVVFSTIADREARPVSRPRVRRRGR